MAQQSKIERADGEPGVCGACGTQGHYCVGPSEDGPTHEDWIGVSNGRPCCHACYEVPTRKARGD